MSSYPAPAPATVGFNEALAPLKTLARGSLADERVMQMMSAFILQRPAHDTRKASRFQALCSLPCFNPNLAIPLMPLDPLSGLEPATERPVEFAISQFLASGGTASWEQCVTAMTGIKGLRPAFDRPLNFLKVILIPSPEGLGEPSLEILRVPAYANGYVRAESPNLGYGASSACARLAEVIESSMSPASLRLCRPANFKLESFGQFAHMLATSLGKPAAAPISPSGLDDFLPSDDLSREAEEIITRSVARARPRR